MNNAKHTQGPWIIDNEVSEDIAGQPTLGIYADGPEEYGYVCGIHCGPDADITEQDYVNATLIAAAPAMYEALREAQELIRSLVAEEMIHSSELQRVGNCQANMWQALSQAEGR